MRGEDRLALIVENGGELGGLSDRQQIDGGEGDDHGHHGAHLDPLFEDEETSKCVYERQYAQDHICNRQWKEMDSVTEEDLGSSSGQHNNEEWQSPTLWHILLKSDALIREEDQGENGGQRYPTACPFHVGLSVVGHEVLTRHIHETVEDGGEVNQKKQLAKANLILLRRTAPHTQIFLVSPADVQSSGCFEVLDSCQELLLQIGGSQTSLTHVLFSLHL